MNKGWRSKLSEDELVSSLGRGPESPEGFRILAGFLGRGSEEGVWRLYTSAELTDYVEFDEADIVHLRKVAALEAGFEGTLVWVKHSARLSRWVPGAGTEHAFLRGSLAAGLLRQLGGGVAFPGGGGFLKTFTVTECATCPTDDGSHTCVPAVCTLATSCLTQVPTDPGCGSDIL